MKTWIDVVESQKPKKDMQLPYFTKEGWVLIFAGVAGVIIGIAIHAAIIMPFCK